MKNLSRWIFNGLIVVQGLIPPYIIVRPYHHEIISTQIKNHIIIDSSLINKRDNIITTTPKFFPSLYNKDLKTGFKTKKEASLFLKRCGFDGFKFIREQDRLLNPIGFNYVIFNDKIIKIIKKYDD